MLFKMHSNCVSFIPLRHLSAMSSEALPVIKVPKYLTTTLNRVRYKEHKKVENFKIQEKERLKSSSEESLKIDKNICIISSNHKKLNHYLGQTYKQRKPIPLISKEWINGRITNGKYLIQSNTF